MARRALVLVLCLSLAAAASADCATQCSLCAGQGHGSESSVRPLMCLRECQGSSPPGAEWETCRKALALLAPLVALAEGTDPSPVEAEDEAEPEQELSPGELPLAPAKRYGGFMKKLAKGKLLALLRENAHSKGGLSKKFGGFSRKPGERAAPEDYPMEAALSPSPFVPLQLLCPLLQDPVHPGDVVTPPAAGGAAPVLPITWGQPHWGRIPCPPVAAEAQQGLETITADVWYNSS